MSNIVEMTKTTYGFALRQAEQMLADEDVPNAALDAEYLLEHLTGWNRARQFMEKDRIMEKDLYERYIALVKERAKRIPLQHIIGTQEFMGLEFEVNEHVLVPRQDTEVLVEHALKILKDGDSVLDLCTGSGCILLSLMKLGPLLNGTGGDISKDALEVANRNKEKLGVNAKFVETDLFSKITKKYDLITSNPPYIPTGIIPGLMPEVREHDPYIALDGKEDGLWFYERITEEAPKHLYRGGYLMYEIGVDQGEAVSAMLERAGFKDIRVEKDYSGNDRVVIGHL
ncbi:release factor glutamine methyltransferase [Lachnospiraceae bacterium A10]|nr:release factor glutamine methyltransferase [Lachnospiraceae bacterium A10]